MLERISVAELEKIVGLKVAGSINLKRAFINPSLDFFIILSSYRGFIGSIERANYTAVNIY